MAPAAKIFTSLWAATLASHVMAAPDPMITPMAKVKLVKKQSGNTIGWVSVSEYAGSTKYSPVTISATWSVVSSGSYLKYCASTSNCQIYTGCSSGYMVGAGTSSYCESTGYTCSYNLYYPSLGSNNRLTRYWCDTSDNTGVSIYLISPYTQFVPSSTRIVSPTVGTTPTSRGSSSVVVGEQTGTATPFTTDEPKKSNVGAIVGGVVGGLALLGLIAGAIVFLLLKNKKKKEPAAQPQQQFAHNATTPAMGQHGMAPQPGMPPAGGYYNPHQSVYGGAAPLPDKGSMSPTTSSYMGSPAPVYNQSPQQWGPPSAATPSPAANTVELDAGEVDSHRQSVAPSYSQYPQQPPQH